MIKILNFFQLIEGVKAFLEVISMIVKGIHDGVRHIKSKNENTQ